ncbi:hypothetical protein [Nisaea denitrificans]|uniref:hypothetical protein n=1 Tax=Nisaea denitrificans TaxID=390877 RepID=UPI0003FA846B|nr:hypothetical protein [Nisaea denitrificans]
MNEKQKNQQDPSDDIVLKRIYAGERAIFPDETIPEWHAGLLTHLQRSNDRYLKQELSKILAQHTRWYTRNLSRAEISSSQSGEALLQSLRSNGFAKAALPKPVTDALRHSAESAPFGAAKDPDSIMDLNEVLTNPGWTSYSTTYANKAGAANILAYPAVAKLATNPGFLGVVEQYLGALPYVGGFEFTLNIAGNGEDVASGDWHSDKDSIAFMKMFVYLSDVGNDNGPHGFVPGSQTAEGISEAANKSGVFTEAQKKALVNIQRWDDWAVEKVFPDRAVFFGGPAGTVILEDTRGLHRATKLGTGHRLMLTIQWCLDLSTLDQPDRIAFEDLPDELKPGSPLDEARFRHLFHRYLK